MKFKIWALGLSLMGLVGLIALVMASQMRDVRDTGTTASLNGNVAAGDAQSRAGTLGAPLPPENLARPEGARSKPD